MVIDVFKDPVTDSNKTSKKGRLELIRFGDGTVKTVRLEDSFGHEKLLQTVFENGEIIKQWTFAEVRTLSNK